jgi:hypothetical protein
MQLLLVMYVAVQNESDSMNWYLCGSYHYHLTAVSTAVATYTRTVLLQRELSRQRQVTRGRSDPDIELALDSLPPMAASAHPPRWNSAIECRTISNQMSNKTRLS